VRAPARLDKDFRWNLVGLLPAPFNDIPLIGGGPDFVSEVADVYEIGYRAQPTGRLSYSVAAFYSEYDKLRSGQTPNLLALVPAYVQNMMYGTTYGVEAWGAYQATDWLRLSGGLLELRKDLRLDPASTDPEGPRSLGNDPEHQWNLRATFTPNPHHELDVMVRNIGRLPDPVVPAYTAVDMRYGWRPVREAELILAVQNLFDSRHPEFGPSGARAEFQRTFYAGVAWRL
jgi:iron complex outermembrane receptor protein